MSDQTINYSHTSLKHINTRLIKMGRLVDRLDRLAYQYLQLSATCRELSEVYACLSKDLDQIDCIAFEIRQEYTLMMERWDAEF